MKKILHVFGKSMNQGGAETLILNLYKLIDRDKFQFDFMVSSKEVGILDKEIKNLGGQIIYNEQLLNPLKLTKKLEEINNKFGPYDAIHSHVFTYSGIVLKSAKKVGIPIRIAHSHTIINETLGVKRKIYVSLMKSIINTNGTHFLACSQEAAQSLFFKTKKVIIIKNGLNLEDILEGMKNATSLYDLRREYSIPKNAKIIGHVGRFSAVKNHLFIIEVFKDLLNVEPNSFLILVGEGNLKNEVQEIVMKHGIRNRVLFLGHQNDVIKIMQGFDIFIFPSFYEGLGIVVIEAQLAGVHCFVSKTITRDVDLELGLIDFLDLRKGSKYWVEKMVNLKSNEVSLSERVENIQLKGYDLKDVEKQISKIYSDDKCTVIN